MNHEVHADTGRLGVVPLLCTSQAATENLTCPLAGLNGPIAGRKLDSLLRGKEMLRWGRACAEAPLEHRPYAQFLAQVAEDEGNYERAVALSTFVDGIVHDENTSITLSRHLLLGGQPAGAGAPGTVR